MVLLAGWLQHLHTRPDIYIAVAAAAKKAMDARVLTNNWLAPETAQPHLNSSLGKLVAHTVALTLDTSLDPDAMLALFAPGKKQRYRSSAR